jgi:DNA-binding CsgD family transcriptional regulator
MSEAENSNNNPSLFESVPPSEPVEPDSLAEEWTTVDFPNALPVDEIPHATPENPDQSELLQSLSDRIQVLEQQNQDLHRQKDDLIGVLEKQDQEFHAQVANLNKALQQTRNMLRLERRSWESQSTQIKRRSHEQTAHIAQQTQELTTNQEQVVKLFRELEHSQQIAQRQQILVETLTNQLEASQEQVAQLERECALTQQRYTDQTQLVHQTENACKDLRSRLLRQQRYTMQFKTALEKCLDVPVAKSIDSSNDLSLNTGAEYFKHDTTHHPSDLLAPKAQPVQPWSAQPEFVELEPLLEDPQLAYIPSPWDEEPILGETDDRAFHREINDASVVEIEEELFELPVMDAPKINPPVVSYTIQRSTASEYESSPSPEIQLFMPDESLPIETQEAELTHTDQNPPAIELDLEQKFEDALQSFESAADPFVSAADFADSLQDDQEILNEIHAIEESANPEQETDLFEPVSPQSDAIERTSSEVAQSPSPFITLRSRVTHHPEEDMTAGEMPLVTSGPSPIVYPLRSSKKLKSLAAVDLPSFPRRSN